MVNRKKTQIQVGVLALQGAFREHIQALQRCGISACEVRQPEQLGCLHGLIIPGGESTTMFKLIGKYGFRPYLDSFYQEQRPMFGTCAGMILLARKVEGFAFGLGYIDIEVQRNSYGRQIDSFEEIIELDLNGSGARERFKAVFIRAPKIVGASKEVKILSRIGQDIVLARQGSVLVSAFHPELEDDLRIHDYFIDMIINTS